VFFLRRISGPTWLAGGDNRGGRVLVVKSINAKGHGIEQQIKHHQSGEVEALMKQAATTTTCTSDVFQQCTIGHSGDSICKCEYAIGKMGTHLRADFERYKIKTMIGCWPYGKSRRSDGCDQKG